MNGIQMIIDDRGALVPEIKNGSMAVGDVLHQNQGIILNLHKGELKENPSVGVGISDMLLDNDPIYWRTEIREQFEMDGMTVDKVKVTKTSIDVIAEY